MSVTKILLWGVVWNLLFVWGMWEVVVRFS